MMKLLQKTAWEKTNQNLSDTPLNLGDELANRQFCLFSDTAAVTNNVIFSSNEKLYKLVN